MEDQAFSTWALGALIQTMTGTPGRRVAVLSKDVADTRSRPGSQQALRQRSAWLLPRVLQPQPEALLVPTVTHTGLSSDTDPGCPLQGLAPPRQGIATEGRPALPSSWAGPLT